jgi:molybdopterin molybdotransferase
MLKTVTALGWRGIYHRVRMSPGKSVGFGLLDQRPFFILPGGPPANEMAFLQLALPALVKMMGGESNIFPVVRAHLTETVTGQSDWTDFIHANLIYESRQWVATPIRLRSRLKSMALKNAIAILPQGATDLDGGMEIETQFLSCTRTFHK